VKNSKRTSAFLAFGISLVVIFLLNFLGQLFFERFDLTSEKRYSISDATKSLLAEVDDVVFARVYLDGELPPDYRKLQTAVKEMLDEFRAYNSKIQYEFSDPSAGDDEEERIKRYRKLTEEGLQYTNIRIQEAGEFSEKVLFPGAIIAYGEKEIPVQLLKGLSGASDEEMVNASIQKIEYELASALKKLITNQDKKIGFLEGQSEYEELKVADLAYTLDEYYTVNRLRMDQQLGALDDYDALIIAGPDSSFDERDKFIIDQFVMRGGKLLILVDGVRASMDSVQATGMDVSVPKSVNLEDMLFRYGVRINPNLIMDMQALPIPVVTGMMGTQARQELYPWYYFPMILPKENHPIVKNLDGIASKFASSIDTIGRKGIRKTILLQTSVYSKLVNAPSRISLNILRQKPQQENFNSGPQALAVLLEGEFESVFNNRMPQQLLSNTDIDFKGISVPNKMIVISDGDIIRNDVSLERQEFFPLGSDKYLQKVHANKEFLMNSIDYMLDDSGLIELRSKELKMRLLDQQKASSARFNWQLFNMSLPLLLIWLMGLALFAWKRNKHRR
jgi:gliding-associated putative ABC transporter substrate-binding component GldG